MYARYMQKNEIRVTTTPTPMPVVHEMGSMRRGSIVSMMPRPSTPATTIVNSTKNTTSQKLLRLFSAIRSRKVWAIVGSPRNTGNTRKENRRQSVVISELDLRGLLDGGGLGGIDIEKVRGLKAK